jgi:hypothetical protein
MKLIFAHTSLEREETERKTKNTDKGYPLFNTLIADLLSGPRLFHFQNSSHHCPFKHKHHMSDATKQVTTISSVVGNIELHMYCQCINCVVSPMPSSPLSLSLQTHMDGSYRLSLTNYKSN